MEEKYSIAAWAHQGIKLLEPLDVSDQFEQTLSTNEHMPITVIDTSNEHSTISLATVAEKNK